MLFVWNICLFFGVKHEPPSWENVGKYSHPIEYLGMRAATKKTTHDPGPLLKGAHEEKENSSEVVICEVSQVHFVELRRKTPQFLSPQNHTERKHPSCVSSYFQAKWPENWSWWIFYVEFSQGMIQNPWKLRKMNPFLTNMFQMGEGKAPPR